ncbi:MAG: hypothetical protein IKH51_02995 [Clostridia bacterium]|nr:hypothetical protein [Clostridia bacterium]
MKYWNDNSDNNEWSSDEDIPKCALDLNIYISEKALKLGIFLSEKDLENDLANSPLKDELLKHYKKNSSDELVIAMQNKKAEYMFTFTKEKKECLSLLKDNKIASPLTTLKSIIEKRNVK